MKQLAKILAPALLCACADTWAQSWPTKTITIVVPFPPGGTTDVLARAVAQKLGPVLGQSVIVDNKPGAGATLGAAQVPKATAQIEWFEKNLISHVPMPHAGFMRRVYPGFVQLSAFLA